LRDDAEEFHRHLEAHLEEKKVLYQEHDKTKQI
jgi:hypothetical protein